MGSLEYILIRATEASCKAALRCVDLQDPRTTTVTPSGTMEKYFGIGSMEVSVKSLSSKSALKLHSVCGVDYKPFPLGILFSYTDSGKKLRVLKGLGK